MRVYVLKESWNNSGDNGVNNILGVHSTLRSAQIALCQQIFLDEQYGGYEHMEANADIDKFNLYEAANACTPIPCTHIRYWDGDWTTSERTLEYDIDFFDVLDLK